MENIKKALTLPSIQVTVKKCFEPETNNYGKTQMNCIVTYKGTEYYATISDKLMDSVKAGVKLTGIRESYRGSFFYKWALADDLPNPDDLPTQVKMGDPSGKEVNWDAIAEGKCRCAVVCAYIQAGKPINQNEINGIVNYIMVGK